MMLIYHIFKGILQTFKEVPVIGECTYLLQNYLEILDQIYKSRKLLVATPQYFSNPIDKRKNSI